MGDVQDVVLAEGEGEPEFQYTELTFADQVNTDHYAQFQKVLKSVKQSQEKWHKKGLDELTKLAEQPHDNDLLEQTKATKLSYIDMSKNKLDQITSNYNELVMFVTSVQFTQQQIDRFNHYIDFHTAADIKAHAVFIDSVNKVKITIENNSTNETPTIPTVAQKFVNRQDLAEKCSTLSADDYIDTTNKFEDNFNAWFQTAYCNTGDLNRKNNE